MKIRCLVTDFDGVMTDGKVYIDEVGIESVRCSRLDGIAIKLLKQKGVRVVILSSETNKVVLSRGRKLDVETFVGVQDKESFLKTFISSQLYSSSEIVFVGDEINDLPCFSLVGQSFCPEDAHPSVRKIASIHLKTQGGNGVLREIVDILYPNSAWMPN